MEPFNKLEGVAAPLNMINVDTDMIIPKQYLKTIHRTGLGKALFDEMRHNPDGSEKPDFVLNKPAYRGAKILVTGDNFGTRPGRCWISASAASSRQALPTSSMATASRTASCRSSCRRSRSTS